MNATTINWSGSAVGRPTSDTLTDRYVWAVLKALPESKRTDIDRELRASIADDVDARVASGEDAAAAERAVLLDLGEPAKLAASYTGRTLGLIGPDLYPGWVALMKMLYIVVLPIATIAYVVVQVFAGTEPGGVLGGTVAIVMSLLVHLGFWTTLVFAIAERTGTAMKGVPDITDGPFDPEQLPSIATVTGTGRSDLIASLVFLVLIPIGLLWQYIAPPLRDAQGDVIPLLHAATEPFWVSYFLVFTVLAAVLAVALYRRGRWTWLLVGLHAAIAVAVTVPLVWLIVNGMLIDPAFLDQLGWTGVVGALTVGAIAVSVSLVAVAIWAIGDTVWKAVKADRLERRA
jgi:hypothetical protein